MEAALGKEEALGVKKPAGIILLLIILIAGRVDAQNLVEVSRKEKERRERLNSERALIVTNEDLANLKKKPAIVVSTPKETSSFGFQIEAEETDRISDSTPRKITPRIAEPGPLLIGKGTSKQNNLQNENLEERLTQVIKHIEELVFRMNALREESYRLEAASQQEMILKQIDELTVEMLKAREEESQLKRLIEERKGEGIKKE